MAKHIFSDSKKYRTGRSTALANRCRIMTSLIKMDFSSAACELVRIVMQAVNISAVHFVTHSRRTTEMKDGTYKY